MLPSGNTETEEPRDGYRIPRTAVHVRVQVQVQVGAGDTNEVRAYTPNRG